MSEHDETPCTVLDGITEELALGLLEPADADAALAHVDGCSSCRHRLDELTALADSLLLLAPEAEPPPGFEARAIAAMGEHQRASSGWLRRVAAAAAIVAVTLGAFLIGNATGGRDAEQAGASGVLVDGRGTAHGIVGIVRGDRPKLVMSLSGVDPGGHYRCSLRTPDGRVTQVADWKIDDSGGGMWTVKLHDSESNATEAVVTEDDGSVIARATLD